VAVSILWQWKWPLFAAAVWFNASLAVAIVAIGSPNGHTVFNIYAVACHQWWVGEDMFLRQVTTNELYRYSPTFSVLTAPFALFQPGVGNALWKLANAAVFVLGLWVWCRRGLPGQLNRDQIAAVFLLAMPVAVGSLYIGQANLMMTGLVLLSLTAIAEDRWWWAAGFLAVATLIKAFPLALAMVLAVLFWRTFPLRFLVALLVGLAFPFATQRPEYVLDQTARWFHHLTESVELNRERLRSLDHLLDVAGAGVKPSLFLMAGAAAGAAVLAVSLLAQWKGAERREVLLRLAAWFLTWAVLFGPSTENVTFGILAPVVAWAVVDAFSWPGMWFRRVWLLLSLYLIGLSYGDPGAALKRWLGNECGVTIGALMFHGVLLIDLFRSRPPRF
jgi:Glycosyltransferase family 87